MIRNGHIDLWECVETEQFRPS